MIDKKINFLDCTFRDGGYYNNWNFSKQLINKYLNIISKTKIKNIEIGFLTLPYDDQKGITANCDHSFFRKIKIPKNINIGIMINATDFLKNNEFEEQKIFKTLKKLPRSKINFIRIACHFKHLFKITKFFKYLKKRGFKMCLNIMQISDIPDRDILKVCKVYKNLADVIYFADSFGSLNEKEFKKIINKFKKKTRINLGIHAHDNMKKALKNTIMASKNNVQWLDSTILGMGRGPGNTQTEQLIKYFYGNNSDTFKKIKKISLKFNSLKKKYNWGTNKYYWLSGKYKIHPTYIQMILSDKRYDNFNFLEIINNLKKQKANKFDPNEFFAALNFFKNKPIKNKNIFKNFFNDKKVLILGSGINLQKNIKKIENTILKNSMKVLAINKTNYINNKLIDMRVYCHPLRILSDIHLIKNSRKQVLIPYSFLPKEIQSNLKNINIVDYGLQLKKNSVKIKKNYANLPKPLALIYAITYLISQGVKHIYLAGFDGYDKSDPFQDETQELLLNIKKTYREKIKLTSLTNTKFKIN